MGRALAAVIHELGALTVSYVNAAKVTEDDQISTSTNKPAYTQSAL
jgi:hypothetical protein